MPSHEASLAKSYFVIIFIIRSEWESGVRKCVRAQGLYAFSCASGGIMEHAVSCNMYTDADPFDCREGCTIACDRQSNRPRERQQTRDGRLSQELDLPCTTPPAPLHLHTPMHACSIITKAPQGSMPKRFGMPHTLALWLGTKTAGRRIQKRRSKSDEDPQLGRGTSPLPFSQPHILP